ncbi:MAG: glycerol acyltransferase [Saprospirales bacterium]|nr:MAG: glycerol acyltransferase [Saprospirales bacterium]
MNGITRKSTETTKIDKSNSLPEGCTLQDYQFELLEKDLRKWPIYKLIEKRADFVETVNKLTVEVLKKKNNEGVQSLIAKTIYQEKIRMKKSTWKVDPPNEKLFWKRIEGKLSSIKSLPPDEAEKSSSELLYRIVNRYTEEIVGNFKINTFKFVRRFSTFCFKVLFNKFFDPYPFWGNRKRMLNRIHLTGSVPETRKLMEKGTVVLVPTHSSNLDSLFIGYAIDFKAGLPSFCYGAGLNLYNSEFAAYFMNRLGAYRLDRRKKNAIYLETLKTMSQKMTMMGVNNLFFPGGTRSRSGAIESRLKLGLLGTLIEAQRGLIESGSQKKIFVVPVVLSYPFVLEARILIDEHLRSEGKEKYFKQKYKKIKRFSKLTFFNHLFTKSPSTWVSFGQPMDVIGNPVDLEGNSLGNSEQIIEIADYFKIGGIVKQDVQRESVYTKVLSDSILESYRSDNVVMSAHFAAYCAFNFLRKSHSDKDIYELFRLEEIDTQIKLKDFIPFCEELKSGFLRLDQSCKLKLTEDFNQSTLKLILSGVKELGHYSARKPLKYNSRKKTFSTEDVKLLYFYHNRLNCYDELIKEALKP